MTNEAETPDSTTAGQDDLPATHTMSARHAADFAGAPLADLIVTARTYYAAINSRAHPIQDDDEFGVLAEFDDFLVAAIAGRAPGCREEFAAKAEYLLGRIQARGLSHNAEVAAWEAINGDFRTWAGAPAVAS